MKLSTEDINSLIEAQLAVWPEAKRNFDALADVGRKAVHTGDFPAHAQYNPARIRSTAADLNPEAIRKRACFLCRANRPEQQLCGELMPGWELLVNPYPILPVHFTIVDTEHRPQDEIPLEMAAMAESAPDLAIFFNGARAGASAPDHRHCQGVLKSELPIVALTENCHSAEGVDIMTSDQWGLNLPFQFVSAVVKPTPEGMRTLHLMTCIKGIDAATGRPDPGLVNAFFWIDGRGYLRIVVIPRRAHRPSCYFSEGPDHMTVSPGALDMAGLLIFPEKRDFDSVTSERAREIYAEVAFADSLPDDIWSC